MTYEFGRIRVDVAARQVWNGEASVHLTRKAFELLTLLLENRPNVVSKEQIHARLWPETFVSESSIQALVSEVRHAIDEDRPADQREERASWVRTVHGVGYAFARESPGISPKSPPVTDPRAWLVAGAWRVALREGDNVLGRSGEDVIEIEASTISRRHARITVGATSWVEDLGSKNGTWVGDRRVTERTLLSDGEQVRLGSVMFTFRLAGRDDSTETVATLPIP